MRSVAICCLAIGFGAAAPLRAQGWIEPVGPGIAASQIVRTGSRVGVVVDGQVARITVEEHFQNRGGGLAEGSYLFPLVGGAVLQDVSLRAGATDLHGEVLDADQARSIYEEIVRRKRDPALLSLEGSGLVRARIFPIAPGETRAVTLTFTELLPREGDALHFRYLLAGRDPMPDSSQVKLTVHQPDRFGTPYSPTHTITTTRRSDRLEVTLGGGAAAAEVYLPLRSGLVATTVSTHAEGVEDGWFMLLLTPPPSSTAAIPRDLTLVVDVSGSMSGPKLEQAKAALQQALGGLTPRDRFRLIAFASQVRPLAAGWLPATSDNIRTAGAFVDGLAAGGGTNIEEALNTALSDSTDSERVSLVVFVTDGQPSVGEAAPDRLAADAAARIGRRRIFTVGIGQDVNTYLLDRLSVEGRGTATYVPPNASVETALGGLLARLQHPALTELRIAHAPVQLVDMAPTVLPDLFYGEQLVVFGRYHGTGQGDVVIEGNRDGHRERFTAAANFPSSASQNGFIPPLWAARRIGDLTRQIRLDGAAPELIRQVRDLGLRYGILTEYTSYLVQEPGAVAAQREVRPAAPSAQSGAAAFEAAKASADLASASNLAAAERTTAQRFDALGGRNGQEVRRVGGRIFRHSDGGWRDAAHADSLPVVTVAPYSEAYFALVRALPELAPYLTLGDTLIVAGRRTSIGLAPQGIDHWNPGQLDHLIRGFRGA